MEVRDPLCIFTWSVRKTSERQSGPDVDYCPEVSDSVRKLFQGLSGVKTIILKDEEDPVIIVWQQSLGSGKSGYLLDEGYDVNAISKDGDVSDAVKMTRTETVNQINFNNGVIEIFTENGSIFHLVTKRLYRVR